jgi:hypothetical protein
MKETIEIQEIDLYFSIWNNTLSFRFVFDFKNGCNGWSEVNICHESLTIDLLSIAYKIKNKKEV